MASHGALAEQNVVEAERVAGRYEVFASGMCEPETGVKVNLVMGSELVSGAHVYQLPAFGMCRVVAAIFHKYVPRLGQLALQAMSASRARCRQMARRWWRQWHSIKGISRQLSFLITTRFQVDVTRRLAWPRRDSH